jgi:hypothetical protein
MQQGAGVWFGVGSNRNVCRLGNSGNHPHVQFSGLSETQQDMHALDAIRALKKPPAQVRGVTGLQQAADTCAVLGGHHAAHAHGNSNVRELQSHNTQSTGSGYILAHCANSAVRFQRPQDASGTPHPMPCLGHGGDRVQHCAPHLAEASLRGVTTTSSAAMFHTFDILEQHNVEESEDVLTHSVDFNSVHSSGSSQAEILHIIADMRRRLQKDLRGSPSQQRLSPHDLPTSHTSVTSPQRSPHKRHPQRLENIHT